MELRRDAVERASIEDDPPMGAVAPRLVDAISGAYENEVRVALDTLPPGASYALGWEASEGNGGGRAVPCAETSGLGGLTF